MFLLVMHVVITLVMLFDRLFLFPPPVDAFVDFVRRGQIHYHHNQYREDRRLHGVDRRQSSYPVDQSTATRTKAKGLFTNELEHGTISTSYKIVAGLDPEWFDRFVVEPLGNTEFIDGQNVEQIIQDGKYVSMEWMEKQRERNDSAKDRDERRNSETNMDTMISANEDEKTVESMIRADHNEDDEDDDDDDDDGDGDGDGDGDSTDFTNTLIDRESSNGTEKEETIDTDATTTNLVTLDSPVVEKVETKKSEQDATMESDLTNRSTRNIAKERVDTFDGSVSESVIVRRDDPDTIPPRGRAVAYQIDQREPPAIVTTNATGNIEVPSEESHDKGRTKVNEQNVANFPSDETTIASKRNETGSPEANDEKAIIDQSDGSSTKLSDITSSSEQQTLDQEIAKDTNSSPMKVRDNDRSTKDQIRIVNEDRLDPQVAPVPLRDSSVESRSSAPDFETTKKEKTKKEKTSKSTEPSMEKGTKIWTRETVGEKQEPSQWEARGGISNSDVKNGTDSSDRVVVYKGLYSRPWKLVPLDKLISLGYNEDDITALIPDTLELIAAEKIQVPRNGIPARWKRKDSSKAVVKVVSNDEAKFLLKSDEPEASTKGSADAKPTHLESTAEKDEMGEDEFRTRPVRSTTRKRRSDGKDARIDTGRFERRESPSTEDRRRRRRERVSTLEDGSPKPVYSGRPPEKHIMSNRRADPPPPGAFWVDMDTFRNLLRKEAELRLQILGDGFADSVKQETMWRHDLYSEWLWTLRNGVGNPIVESRSDRYRRLREQARLEENRDLRKRRERRKRSED